MYGHPPRSTHLTDARLQKGDHIYIYIYIESHQTKRLRVSFLVWGFISFAKFHWHHRTVQNQDLLHSESPQSKYMQHVEIC